MDFISVNNASMVHAPVTRVLIARAGDPSAPKLDEEAFNTTEGEQHHFWD